MKLFIHVAEAKALPLPPSPSCSVYAKLRVGGQKCRTRAVRHRCSEPVWNEEFVFRVREEEEVVEVAVYWEEEEGLLGWVELVGKLRLGLWAVVEEAKGSLPPTWFALRRKTRGRAKERGKILLSMSLSGGREEIGCNPSSVHDSSHGSIMEHGEDPPSSNQDVIFLPSPDVTAASSDEVQPANTVSKVVQKILGRNGPSASMSRSDTLSRCSDVSSDSSYVGVGPTDCTFQEAIELMHSTSANEMPENLKGGILLDKTYAMSSKDLCVLLFEPESKFRKDLVEVQGTTNYVEGPWTWKSTDKSFLTRTLTYVKGPTKYIKSVRAIEEQTFIVANGRDFAILATVNTPEIPYGNCFQVETLYKMMPGQRSSSGEESSQIVISWEVNFFQRTVMRSVIEAGTRHGLKESYEHLESMLTQMIKPLDYVESDDRNITAPTRREHQSDLEFTIEYFWNPTVVITIIMGLVVFLHILLSEPDSVKGLEFGRFDFLPDSFGELVTSGILVLLCERVYNMIQQFIHVRSLRGRDQHIKAREDGWLITVALVEAINLPPSGSSESLDPYVVLMCNGKTKTSSVKLQTLAPQWNEVLEFDAMHDPPSVLDVEVCNYDGKFETASSIGHAEINFLRLSPAELADIWVPLQGKLAQAYQSKVHLRIFLGNTKGEATVKDYLNKMEKEVGKKLNPPSPQKTLAFQKIFGLPPDEILVESFSCYLKRKILVQGKLYLSARIVGFYSNMLGYKTKFFLLWEDIEDIQVAPPSLATVGCPLVSITLKKGRGIEARQGVKSMDEEGRYKFQFLAFISFGEVNRMMMALWKTRSSSAGQMEETTET